MMFLPYEVYKHVIYKKRLSPFRHTYNTVHLSARTCGSKVKRAYLNHDLRNVCRTI
jgi:hypothetical protein